MARRALMLREGVAPVWDRLLTMVFLAGLLHGLVIVGLTFNAAASDKASAPGLEVLLVSDELPEADKNPTATYLAQRTQVGSGNTRKSVAPRNRAASLRLRHAGTAEGNSLRDEGERAGSTEDERVLSTIGWSTSIRYLTDEGGEGASRDKPLLLDQPQSAEPGPDEDGPAQLRGPQRDELWITPDTRAATLAPYLDAWRRKVERIGTLNYPTVAKRGRRGRRPGGGGRHRRRRQARSGADPALQRQRRSSTRRPWRSSSSPVPSTRSRRSWPSSTGCCALPTSGSSPAAGPPAAPYRFLESAADDAHTVGMSGKHSAGPPAQAPAPEASGATPFAEGPAGGLTNHLLIAMPQLADPNFAQTVALICEHTDKGALGIVLNKPLPMKLSDVLSQMKLEPSSERIGEQPVLRGGPVHTDRGFVLHRPGGQWDHTHKVSEHIQVTTSRDVLAAMARGEGPSDAFIALGYAGWESGQLEREMKDNAWASVPVDARLVFELPFEQRWAGAWRLLGIDVDRLSPEAGHA